MKLQKIVERLQKLHPKKIDLSLDRTRNLLEKLGNPQGKRHCLFSPLEKEKCRVGKRKGQIGLITELEALFR